MLDAMPAGSLDKLQTNDAAFVAMKQRLARLPAAPPAPKQ
jgi:hypothetical protein